MPLSKLLHERTLRALVLAGALIALWAWQGPLTKHSVPSQPLVRHAWKQCADVVFVGDSTVRQGIYADLVEQPLGARVANFGYPGQAIADDDYLTAAEAVLDPSNPDRAIVISVNSWGASERSKHVFRKEAADLAKAIESGQPPQVGLAWRDELDLRLAARGVCGFLWNACRYETTFALGPGGQLVIEQWRDDETNQVPEALHYFAGTTFQTSTLDPLVARIGELVQRGVHVFAYVERDRPLIAAITKQHGFDPDRVELRLREAGATIIPYPLDLATRDGTHLARDAAKRWSAQLGATLAKTLPRHTGPRCAWPE